MTTLIAPHTGTDADVQRRMAEVDGILNAAGCRVSDPELRQFLEQQAGGELTVDQTVGAILDHTGHSRAHLG